MPDNEYFGRIGYVIPMAIVGTNKAECVMEVTAFTDGTEIEIKGKEKRHHACIGTDQVYRVHGGHSYGMNDGDTAVAGNENTPNLLVGQMPRCRLVFMGDSDGNGTVDWLDGAKLLATDMPCTPTTYFNDKLVYLVAGKYKPEKQPRTTFAQSEELIKNIAMLTDYAPQVPLISGWAYDGQDTGFPSEDSVNESLGGYQGLMHLMQAGGTYHANVSLNTNYDDAYKSSPIFDTNFIARRPDGQVWKSRDWAGDTSYVVGMAKFMATHGMSRIDYMMAHYPVHDALLIDAMSWFSIRNDWDRAHPASGYRNLTEGKFRIIDEFRRRGVQVMSEQLRYPFIGKLAVTANGSGGGECLFGGQPIPFLATVYRKSAIWGAGNFPPDDQKRNFFWNCRPMRWYDHASDVHSIADYYYMTVLPYSKIHDRAIEQYEANGFGCRIGLGKGSSIRISHGATVPDKNYCEKFFNRTVDLIDQYQPDLVYFDDTVLPLYPISDVGLRIAAHLYNRSMEWHDGRLEAVINGKVLDENQQKCMVWDIERGQSDHIEALPWQTDTCLGEWHYDRRIFERHGYKTAKAVIHRLADVVSKNGNLLLNVPVRGDGTIDSDEQAIVEEIAAWLKMNGESIFETRPWKICGEGPALASAAPLKSQGFNEGSGKPFTGEDIRFTTKKNALYAIALGAPSKGLLVLKSLGSASIYYPGKIGQVILCSTAQPLSFSREERGLVIQLPENLTPVYAYSLKIVPA